MNERTLTSVLAMRLGLLVVATALGASLVGCGPTGSPEPRRSSTASPPMVAPSPIPQYRDRGVPRRVRVPAIGVDAEVEQLGLAADGSQEVPASLHTIGWWRDGARPGQSGNVVLVGHTARTLEGVFDDLGRVSVGDEVIVHADDIARYRVVSTEEIPVEDFRDHVAGIYRRSGYAGMVLMTCSGWDGQRYDTTTVVRARLT